MVLRARFHPAVEQSAGDGAVPDGAAAGEVPELDSGAGTGVATGGNTGAGSGPAAPPPPPPPPPPGMLLEKLQAAGGGGGGGGADTRGALMSALNRGSDVTSGLRKVTADMKTKNQKDRSGAPLQPPARNLHADMPCRSARVAVVPASAIRGAFAHATVHPCQLTPRTRCTCNCRSVQHKRIRVRASSDAPRAAPEPVYTGTVPPSSPQG